MADYNIYIHAIGTGVASASNPTTPWSAREGGQGLSQTTSQTSGDGSVNVEGAFNAVIRTAGYASNPDALISKAVTSLARAFPIIAAAYAVVQLGEAVINNAIEFSEIETGDYRFGVQYQNVKAINNLVFHPVSSVVQNYKAQNQWQRENYKLRAQRELLGDSVINSYTNRGV